MNKILIMICFCLLAAGCGDKDKDKESEEVNIGTQICLEAGGIPIFSLWDNRLIDCIFKPIKEEE